MKSLSNNTNIIKSNEEYLQDKQLDAFFSEKRFTDKEEICEVSLEKEIVKKARLEAEHIINEAKKQAIQEIEHGYEEGLKRGLTMLEPLEQTLQGLIDTLKSFSNGYAKELEPKIVQMVMTICAKIIKETVSADENMITRTVQEALRVLIDRECVCVRINESDMGLLKEFQQKLLEKFSDVKHFELVEDNGIARGGCIIETNQGNIDATIESQCKRLHELVTTEKVLKQQHT